MNMRKSRNGKQILSSISTYRLPLYHAPIAIKCWRDRELPSCSKKSCLGFSPFVKAQFIHQHTLYKFLANKITIEDSYLPSHWPVNGLTPEILLRDLHWNFQNINKIIWNSRIWRIPNAILATLLWQLVMYSGTLFVK